MTALTISGATVGYDKTGIGELSGKVHTDVIETAKTDLGNNLSNLDNAVDEIWQGIAADNFKSNMQKDVEAIKGGLDQAASLFDNELKQIQQRMAEIDEKLIQKK